MEKINEIVNLFDLQNTKLQNEKIRILYSWKDNFSNKEFDILMKVLKNYSYYSERAVGLTYKKIIDKEFNSQKMNDTENLYLPLTTKEMRTESSEVLFYQFYKSNDINTNYVKYANSSNELQKIYKAWSKYAKIVDQNGDLVNNSNEKIKEKLERDYIGIKRIFLIDDFVGTGSSVKNFLRQNNITIKELTALKLEINFIFIAGTNFGFDEIQQTIESYELENVSLYYFEKIIEFFDIHLNNKVLVENEINIIEKKLNELYSIHNIRPGKYNRNTAISSFHNAPNCNIPLLINSTDSWDALFERKKRYKTREVDKSTLKDNLRRLRNG